MDTAPNRRLVVANMRKARSPQTRNAVRDGARFVRVAPAGLTAVGEAS